MITTLDILVKGKEVIQRGWCKHAYARNEHGEQTGTAAKDAVCFCMMGATRRARLELDPEEKMDGYGAREQADELLRECVDGSISYFNDHVAQSIGEVVEKFDCAIRRAEEKRL